MLVLSTVYLLLIVNSLCNLSIPIESENVVQRGTQLEHLGPDLLALCTSARPFLGVKTCCQDLLKTLAKKHGLKFFAADLVAYALVGVSL